MKTVPDSPERGFELALYFAVTEDPAASQEALTWAAAHPCERRQLSLIRDWVGPVPSAACSTPPTLRDEAFNQILANSDLAPIAEKLRTDVIPKLIAAGLTDSADLYQLIETLTALRANSAEDARAAAPQFFRNLPVEFLLALKPAQIEKPDSITHIAALALVALDPNLEASQFLQGWAMEDSQTLHTGPGVAYEFLWADPYLPGIAYQNRDPWLYDPDAPRLYARSDWTPNACWIEIAHTHVTELNCPAGWKSQPVEFGTLLLTPNNSKCLAIERQDPRHLQIVWGFPPNEPLAFRDKKLPPATADSNGFWRPAPAVQGAVCLR